ncbi:hypothetical protein HDV57DRAFT_511574 [Trichoderma longibrachiatum]
MAIVAASTSSTAQLVVSGYDMRTHAAAEPGSAMRTVVAGVGSGRAGVRPARKDDGLTRSILCSKQSTLLCKRHSRGRLTRQRRASENGNRDAGTGGSVAECISPHPARNKGRCELCEAIRAEASSRSSSSCQTADSRRRRCECCGQQGGRDWP